MLLKIFTVLNLAFFGISDMVHGQETSSCNDTSLALFEFTVKNESPIDEDYKGKDIFWRIQLSNGTVIDECDDNWGCELEARSLKKQICLDLSQGCHRLALMGQSFDEFSVIAKLDGIEVASSTHFQTFAADIGEDCESCQEGQQSEVEVFIKTNQYYYYKDPEKNYEILPTISWNVTNGPSGDLSLYTQYHYEKFCVDGCSQLTFSVPEDARRIEKPTNQSFDHFDFLNLELRVDGYIEDFDYQEFDVEEGLSNFSYQVGDCSVEDLCESDERLLQVDVVTGLVYQNSQNYYGWRLVSSNNLRINDMPGYDVTQWDPFQKKPKHRYRTKLCIPTYNCQSLVHGEGGKDSELQAFINGEEVFVKGTCDKIRDSNAKSYCKIKDFPQTMETIPLGGEECAKFTRNQRIAFIAITPIVIIALLAFCVRCYNKKVLHRQHQDGMQKEENGKNWAHAIPNGGDSVENAANPPSVTVNGNEDENGSSDDEC